ncbi:MAG TPA: TIGR01841 family phasin [Burkholderiaceae bacterium]|nr:TIGR01841 family phasin [Burkholderiaceae bacterium]
MFPTPAQFADLQKGQVDALNAYGHVFFNAAEKLVQLQLATGRNLVREASEAAQGFAGARDPQEWFALSQGSAQPAVEKVLNYSRQLYGIASGMGAELSKIAESQVSEGNRRVAEFIEAAAKSAPAGTEPAVAWFKNAVAAGNSAFESLNKAAQQAVETTESNFAAVAGEVVKAKPRKAA